MPLWISKNWLFSLSAAGLLYCLLRLLTENGYSSAFWDSRSTPKSGPRACSDLANLGLVVVYNSPLYESVPLFRKLYGQFFRTIWFCGPLSRGMDESPDMIRLEIHNGIHGYACMVEVMRRDPDSEGYLYINDDVFLSVWNWRRENGLDKRLLYLSPNQFERRSDILNATWYWWFSRYGFERCTHALHALLPSPEPNGSTGNAATHAYCYSGRSDVFFVPQAYRMEFMRHADVFLKYDVFLEIAVPTIVHLIAAGGDVGSLLGYYMPGDIRKNDPRVTDPVLVWSYYLSHPKLWFLHPIKLHLNKFNQLLVEKIFLNEDVFKHKCSSIGYTS